MSDGADPAAADMLERGVRAWWGRLSGWARVAIIVAPALLALGAAGYLIGDVRGDVGGHELRIQAVERVQAARAAAEAERARAAEAVSMKVDALGAKLDTLKAAQDTQSGKLDIIIRRLP